jgi:hypothetical protein
LLPELNPDRGLIFRITHRANLPWILDNGLHCRKAPKLDPDFVDIGIRDLIDKRHLRVVPCHPGGTLSDYVPFYFTPLSMMAFNIHTGRNVRQRDNSEIVILVSSLHNLKEQGVAFLFTDRHASLADARFSANLADLDRVDWGILQRRDFSRDNDDLGKTSRYQAEGLVHRGMATDSLLRIACCNEEQKANVERLIEKRKLNLRVVLKMEWYF